MNNDASTASFTDWLVIACVFFVWGWLIGDTPNEESQAAHQELKACQVKATEYASGIVAAANGKRFEFDEFVLQCRRRSKT